MLTMWRLFAPKTMPSRDFLVQQAVLNAALERYKEALDQTSMRFVLRYATDGGRVVADGLYSEVIRQFRLLVQSYGGTTCPNP